MNPSQMQFPVQTAPGYQAFAGMGAAMPSTTVMGAMMAQSGAAMMGPSPGMMVGMTMPNGFMGNAPGTGVMGMAPRMMGPQSAAMPAMMPAQGMYAMQPGQQPQWNMAQVCQHRHVCFSFSKPFLLMYKIACSPLNQVEFFVILFFLLTEINWTVFFPPSSFAFTRCYAVMFNSIQFYLYSAFLQ